jgi:hypothetical protein
MTVKGRRNQPVGMEAKYENVVSPFLGPAARSVLGAVLKAGTCTARRRVLAHYD